MRRRARSKRVREVDAVPAHRPRAVFALAQPTRVAGFKLAPERVARVDPRALALPARLPARAAAHRTPRLGRGIGATRRVAARVVGCCVSRRVETRRARGARRARGRRRRGRRERWRWARRRRARRRDADAHGAARGSAARAGKDFVEATSDNGTKLECDERRRAISCS